MDFVIEWLWYLLAFVAGSAAAWAIARVRRGDAARALVAVRTVLFPRLGADVHAVEEGQAGAGVRVADDDDPRRRGPADDDDPRREAAADHGDPRRRGPADDDDPRRRGPADDDDPRRRGPADDDDPRRERDADDDDPDGAICAVWPGLARAGAEGAGPAGWLVKGRSDTRLYYTPDDATYERTVAQVWFKDEQSAMRAYFTPWRESSRK